MNTRFGPNAAIFFLLYESSYIWLVEWELSVPLDKNQLYMIESMQKYELILRGFEGWHAVTHHCIFQASAPFLLQHIWHLNNVCTSTIRCPVVHAAYRAANVRNAPFFAQALAGMKQRVKFVSISSHLFLS